MDSFRIAFTEQAGTERAGLSAERRHLLDRGLSALARNPYHRASAQIGGHETDRKAAVAPGMLVEYVISHAIMIVVVLEMFDDMQILSELPDTDDGN